MFAANQSGARRGLTLVELMISIGLTAVLVVALVKMLETSLGVWGRTEARRDILEQATAISELISVDLLALEGGERGDLLVDWEAFDTDSDGIRGLFLPRLRMVRRISEADLSRRGLIEVELDANGEPMIETRRAGSLLEVTWAMLPGETGSLVRGERLLSDEESFFDDDFFDPQGLPPAGAVSEVSDTVLWFGLVFASQTSDLTGGWRQGEGLLDCASAWDAQTSGRTDEDLTTLNSPPAGCPMSKGLPVFPRRVRIELEVERRKDLDKRTTLAETIDPKETLIVLRDERFAPRKDGFVRLDEEWMEVTRVNGKRLTVVRGARGSRNTDHDAGVLVHFGSRSVRELRVAAYREDWNL